MADWIDELDAEENQDQWNTYWKWVQILIMESRHDEDYWKDEIVRRLKDDAKEEPVNQSAYSVTEAKRQLNERLKREK